jgi:hypothetical protein
VRGLKFALQHRTSLLRNPVGHIFFAPPPRDNDGAGGDSGNCKPGTLRSPGCVPVAEQNTLQGPDSNAWFSIGVMAGPAEGRVPAAGARRFGRASPPDRRAPHRATSAQGTAKASSAMSRSRKAGGERAEDARACLPGDAVERGAAHPGPVEGERARLESAPAPIRLDNAAGHPSPPLLSGMIFGRPDDRREQPPAAISTRQSHSSQGRSCGQSSTVADRRARLQSPIAGKTGEPARSAC